MDVMSAKLVAEGVGLPSFWYGGDATGEWYNKGHQYFAGEHVDLTDYQTRAGLLRQLAIWAGDDGKAQAYWLEWNSLAGGWTLYAFGGHAGTRKVRTFDLPPLPPKLPDVRAREALAVIVEHIGRDHAIRRALGWTVEPGTLASLARHETHPDTWVLAQPDLSRYLPFAADLGFFATFWRAAPALAGITASAEALRVIHEAVCP